MKHVHVRHFRKRRGQPLQDKARLHERQIERLAVVGHDTHRAGGKLRDRFEQRTLGAEVRQEELPQPERRAVEPTAANKKGIRARATGKAGGFEVEEEKLS